MIFPARRTEITSTVSGLSDDQLLKQTGKLAGLDHQIHVFVIDHLIEIEARRVYLDRGFSSLFDYVKRGLGYTDAATWRRTSAMKLCARIEGVRERLWDGSLTLDAAAQLQHAFERRDRFQRRDRKRAHTARSNGSAAPAGSAQAKPEPEAAPGPILDLSAQKALVEQAAGKSTREVTKMLADVDPALAVPADRVRPLGAGRWELKAVIDAECERGLEQLKGLLSHVDPRMTLGQLVGRLVREGLDRHDPSRPPRRAGTRSAPARAGRPSAPRRKTGADGDAASEPKRPATNADAATSAPRAQAGSAGVLSPAQRSAQRSVDVSAPANSQRNADRRATSAPKRTDRTNGIGTSVSNPDRDSEGRAPSAARQPPRPADFLTSAPKPPARPEGDPTSAPTAGARAGHAIRTAVRRQAWQPDGGRCRYVDPLTARPPTRASCTLRRTSSASIRYSMREAGERIRCPQALITPARPLVTQM